MIHYTKRSGIDGSSVKLTEQEFLKELAQLESTKDDRDHDAFYGQPWDVGNGVIIHHYPGVDMSLYKIEFILADTPVPSPILPLLLAQPSPPPPPPPSPEQLGILQHALGLDQYARPPHGYRGVDDDFPGCYRNRYICDPNSQSGQECEAMITHGWMKKIGVSVNVMVVYIVTRAGYNVVKRHSPAPPSPEVGEKIVDARWTIELYAECPHCESYVDVLTDPDFWDCHTGLEVGERDTSRADDLEVKCPKPDCGGYFHIKCHY